jgi:hypothetical protein
MSDKPHIEPGTMIWVRDNDQLTDDWYPRKFVSYSGYTAVVCESEFNPDNHFHWDQFSLTDPTKEDQSTPIPDYSEAETMDDIKPSPGQEAITREGQALLDLLLRKNRDYGNSAMTPPILSPTMTPREAIQCRMSDKVRRLERLLGGNQATVNESIEDTIRDLGGYCILWLAAED